MNSKLRKKQYFVIFLKSTSLNWVKISMRLTKLLVTLIRLEKTSRNPRISRIRPTPI